MQNSALSPTFFIENLTLMSWFLKIMPFLVTARLNGTSSPRQCYFFAGSRLASSTAKVTSLIVGWQIDKLSFKQVEMRDEAGRMVRLRVGYQDLAEFQQMAQQQPEFKEMIRSGHVSDALGAYLRKSVVSGSVLNTGTIWRALLLIQVCRWKAAELKPPSQLRGQNPVFFIERRAWLYSITTYAAKQGVVVVPVFGAVTPFRAILGLLPPKLLNRLRSCYYFSRNLRSKTHRAPQIESAKTSLSNTSVSLPIQPYGPKIMAEYYGQLNLSKPSMYSDLFFYQTSSLPAEDILLGFSIPRDPLNHQKFTELYAYNIYPVVLHPAACTVREIPTFTAAQNIKRPPRDLPSAKNRSLESRWLNRKIKTYQEATTFWGDIFLHHNVKVYVSWFKYNETHCAIAGALQENGGIMAIYQRAYEGNASAEAAVYADIAFGFSPAGAEVDRKSGSNISYHVATGYIGDHRIPMLSETALKLRKTLQSNGAQMIIAFSDENSSEDERWHTGHDFMRENYDYLLRKVLDEDWLGLVVKPKAPNSLRQRLGPVAELLRKAEETGRCFVFEDGYIQGYHPPVEAALSADVTVHGHLCAATAGLEAALAGTPTVMLDREGWPDSPLYSLGVGSTVFTDWDDLWRTCQENWNSPSGVPGFGDWSPMLDELDPFRDGRAAERLGEYLNWLLQGFRDGKDRESVMADAADKYCRLWGTDKVTEVTARCKA